MVRDSLRAEVVSVSEFMVPDTLQGTLPGKHLSAEVQHLMEERGVSRPIYHYHYTAMPGAKYPSIRSVGNYLPLVAILILVITGCTTSAWMVKEEPVRDPDSETIVYESISFQPVVLPAPQNPVISLELINQRALQYDMHMASERYIQRYRPRYGYLAVSAAGMGLGLYLANSPALDADRLSGRERAMLNLAALSIGTAGYMTMKPTGEARPAGERRLLQKKGIDVFLDTIPASLPGNAEAKLSIVRGEDSLVSERNVSFSDNTITMHLGQETGIRRLPVTDTTGLNILLEYRNVRYEKNLSLSDFMREYVEVTSSSVPIRSSPATLSNNIIRHVGSESRFPFIDDVDDRWYRILHLEGAAYLRKDESEKIWQVADTARVGDRIVMPDQLVFGDLDIERNLPDNRRANPDAMAIAIINGAYRTPVRYLPHASRTGQLVENYLNQVMGYYSDNIRVFENMTAQEMENLLEEADSLMIGGRYLSMDESDLFVYYYGHAFSGPGDRLYLIPVDYDPGDVREKLVSVERLVDTLTRMRSRQTVLVLDTDWSRASVFGRSTQDDMRRRPAGSEYLEAVFSNLPPGMAAFWSAQPGQRSETYGGNNNRRGYPYDIFTWYFFSALQDGLRSSGNIEEYLERNVPFTSRRLHDRAQNSGFAGSRDVILVPDPQEPTETGDLNGETNESNEQNIQNYQNAQESPDT